MLLPSEIVKSGSILNDIDVFRVNPAAMQVNLIVVAHEEEEITVKFKGTLFTFFYLYLTLDFHNKKGRPSVLNDFPVIVDLIEELLTTNGLAADDRRRKGMQYYGTSLDMIVDHLLSTVPLLREKHPRLNASTIAHLMTPPRLGKWIIKISSRLSLIP